MTNANPKQGRRGLLLLLGFGGSENLKTLNRGGDTKAGGGGIVGVGVLGGRF